MVKRMNGRANDVRDELRNQAIAMVRRPRRDALTWLMLVTLSASAGGCAVAEALIDGLYGGISDTVSTVVTGALLGGE